MAQNFNTGDIGYNFMHFSHNRNNKDFHFQKQNSSDN